MKRKYLTSSVWMLSEKLMKLIGFLLVDAWIARYLGTFEFGILSIVLTVNAIYYTLLKLGLDNIVIQDLIRMPNRTKIILGTAFWLRIIPSLLFMVFFGCIATIMSRDILTFMAIISVGVVFYSWEVIDYFFHSMVLGKLYSLSRIVQLVLSLIIKAYLILSGSPLIFFVLAIVVDAIILAFLSFYIYKIYICENSSSMAQSMFFTSFNKTYAISLIKQSWPIYLTTIMTMIYIRVDQLMMAMFTSMNEVGVFSAAVRICFLWYVVPSVLTTSLFTAVLAAKQESYKLYLLRLEQLFRLLIWMSIIFAVVMSFVGGNLILLLFGVEYFEAIPILQLYCWAGVFGSLNFASQKWYASENLQKIALFRTFVGALSNILLNILLIPAYGGIGAAIATIVSQGVVTYFSDAINVKTRHMFVIKTRALFLRF